MSDLNPVYLLVGLHAGLGEVAGLLFIWALVEIINNTPAGLIRAKKAALWGVVFIFASWITAGIYYVSHYGGVVKPVIMDGPLPWAHGVVLETKEHVFMYIPLLALVGYQAVRGIAEGRGKPVLSVTKWLLGLNVLLSFLMAWMGFLVSFVARLSAGGVK
jgi:hypothetical protein